MDRVRSSKDFPPLGFVDRHLNTTHDASHAPTRLQEQQAAIVTAGPPSTVTSTPQPSENARKFQPADSNKRTHTTTACDDCRKRRARCGPEIPCEQCLKRGIECKFTSREDGRTREAKKRIVVYTQETTKRALSKVLSILRATDSAELQSFMTLVYRGASVEEILHFLEEEPMEDDAQSITSQTPLEPEQQPKVQAQPIEPIFTPSIRNVLNANPPDSPGKPR